MVGEPLRIIVAAGGTGGDLFPAVAVVEQLQLRRKVDAVFVGNAERIEAQVVPSLGFRFEGLSVRGFKGLRSIDTYLLPYRIAESTLKVRSLIKSFKPHLALCAGTYISYPLALAASMSRIPVLIESNAIPGKANRSVARRADLIIAAFEECRKSFVTKTPDVLKVIGNPIRKGFGAVVSREQGAQVFGLDAAMKTLLVFGGSLGARSINETILENLHFLQSEGIQILWQTGKNATIPDSLPRHVIQRSFIDDMASAYAAADAVLCRSGGGTVAELKVVAKPALLVPYPYAANNEQEFNARALQDAGAAVMILDGELKTRFRKEVSELFADPVRLQSRASAMAAMARPNAASDAAELVLSC